MAGGRSESWWARHACDAFGFEGRLRRVAVGIDTTFMLVEPDGTRSALRIGALPVRTSDALQAECDWIGRLGANNVLRIPTVRTDPGGASVVDLVDGHRTRPAMALSWLPGRKMRWRFSVRHAARLGAAAAALHQDAASRPAPVGVKDWTDRICGVGDLDALAAHAGQSALETVAAVQSAVRDACHALRDPSASGLIIGDLGPHNANWLPDDDRAGLFDFNDTGRGPFAFDLARFLHSLRWRDNGELLVQAALDGYSTIAPLPPGWVEHGELFEAASGLFLARYLAPQVERRGPDTIDTIRRLTNRAREILG